VGEGTAGVLHVGFYSVSIPLPSPFLFQLLAQLTPLKKIITRPFLPNYHSGSHNSGGNLLKNTVLLLKKIQHAKKENARMNSVPPAPSLSD